MDNERNVLGIDVATGRAFARINVEPHHQVLIASAIPRRPCAVGARESVRRLVEANGPVILRGLLD